MPALFAACWLVNGGSCSLLCAAASVIRPRSHLQCRKMKNSLPRSCTRLQPPDSLTRNQFCAVSSNPISAPPPSLSLTAASRSVSSPGFCRRGNSCHASPLAVSSHDLQRGLSCDALGGADRRLPGLGRQQQAFPCLSWETHVKIRAGILFLFKKK